MKSKTLETVNNAVNNATPEAVSKLGLRKAHTNYASAFAINEHAELRLDVLNGNAVGRIEEVRYTTYGIVYNVAMSVNIGSEQDPVWGWHSGRLIEGVNPIFLRAQESDLPNDLKDKFPQLPSTKHQVGDVVSFTCDVLGKDAIIPNNIPVLIWGVSYEEGKVLYDVSVDAAIYADNECKDTVNGRYTMHSMCKIDSIFIQPVGGWSPVPVIEEK